MDCICSWGCFPGYCGVRRVLFAGLRDGDVTVWYQSSRLQQWASMGHEGAVTEWHQKQNYLLPNIDQKLRWQQVSKFGLSVEPPEEMRNWIPLWRKNKWNGLPSLQKCVRQNTVGGKNFGKILSVWCPSEENSGLTSAVADMKATRHQMEKSSDRRRRKLKFF